MSENEQLLDTTVRAFLDELASGTPTPGGGSVAAITGAMAAGLITMVCDLTIGKKQYAEFEDEARSIRERAEALRDELQRLAQDDIDVFNRLMAAYKLPRTTEADAASRRAAIQEVTKLATDVPLRTGRAIVSLLPLCMPLMQNGNRTALGDVGAAALLIKAAAPAALLNVESNVQVLEDQLFVRNARAQAEDLTAGLDEEVAQAIEIMRGRLTA
jgi:formiminotetrahydrofolate cyclodeaminase